MTLMHCKRFPILIYIRTPPHLYENVSLETIVAILHDFHTRLGYQFYQKKMSHILLSLAGVVCMMDGMLIFGQAQQEHDQ